MDTVLHESPLGMLRLTEQGGALTGIGLAASGGSTEQVPLPEPARSALLREACAQLDAYFEGRLTVFDLPLDLKGTEFQMRIWAVLRSIPYGHTLTYGETAAFAGSSGASRAAGGACHRNPVLIVVPCHRVVGAGGILGGFGAGLPAKRFLLAHEGLLLEKGGGVVRRPASGMPGCKRAGLFPIGRA